MLVIFEPLLFVLIVFLSTCKCFRTGRSSVSQMRSQDVFMTMKRTENEFSKPLTHNTPNIIAAGMMALTLNTGEVQAAGTSTAALETAITSLESATSRADTIQGLADVFEAAETKTLLVRTKYKTRIIKAINKKHVDLNNDWDSVLGYESGELKRRVDPFRTVDLKDYLKIAPLAGGACYLGALFIQQAVPELFVFAYPGAVLLFALPIVFTIITT